MKRTAIQIFCCLLAVASSNAEVPPLHVGSKYAIDMADVDGRHISTADGHVTVLVVIQRDGEGRAQTLGDRVPGRFIGKATHRIVTVINLESETMTPLRGIANMLIRRHRDAHIADMRKVYLSKNIKRDPLQDIFAVADFDGHLLQQLHAQHGKFVAMVFGRDGRLFANWDAVPTSEALASAMTSADSAGQ